MMTTRFQSNTGQLDNHARFNVLLTEDRQRTIEHWTKQLPRFLEPQGVRTFVAKTGEEAVDLAGRQTIHAALIDVSTPRSSAPESLATFSGQEQDGIWLLELLRRMPDKPPIVVVNHRPFTQRQIQRFMNQAIKMDVFSVIDRPDDIETLLGVIRRLVDRQYAGLWPDHHAQQ